MIYFGKSKTVILPICLFLLSFAVFSQDYPNKIRGYKVYQTKISVKTEKEESKEKHNAEAFVRIGEPELENISLSGITLNFSASVEGIEQSGKVDFLMFEDFKVNGLEVEIEEYKNSFELKKNEKIILPEPVRVFVRADRALRGAFKELKDSKKNWKVTGRVFVFGKFKKFGLSFKRVVPVEINFQIENPVKNKSAQNDDSNKIK